MVEEIEWDHPYNSSLEVQSSHQQSGVSPQHNVSISGDDSYYDYYNYSYYGMDEEISAFEEAVYYMNVVGLPIVIAVGVIGNILSLMVFLCTHLKLQSSSIYLAFLNLVDTLFLLSLLLVWFGWVEVTLIHRQGWCQFVVYITYVTSFLSVWTVVSFTVERAIVVFHPLKRHRWCTKERAMGVVIAFGIGSLVLYSYSTWTTVVIEMNGVNFCLHDPNYAGLLKVLSNLDTLITMVIPSLAIIVLNVGITVKIWEFMYKRRECLTATSTIHKTSFIRSSEKGKGGEKYVQLKLGRRGTRPRPPSPPASKEHSHSLPHQISSHSSGKSEKLKDGQTKQQEEELRHLQHPHNDGEDSGPSSSHSSRSTSSFRTRRTFCSRVQANSSMASTQAARRTATLQLRTTRCLLIISSMFVVLNLPSHAFRVYTTVVYLRHGEHALPRKVLLCQHVLQMLYYMNFAANFFLYCACSRTFRAALGRLLDRWKHATKKFKLQIVSCFTNRPTPL